MVEQVTLQEPEAASAGRPNFLGSFASSIRGAGNLGQRIVEGTRVAKQAAEGTVLNPLVAAALQSSELLATKGGSREHVRNGLLSVFRSIQASTPLNAKQLREGRTLIANVMSPEGGFIGPDVADDIAEEKAQRDARTEFDAATLTRYMPDYKQMTPEKRQEALFNIKETLATTERNQAALENLNSRTDLSSAERKDKEGGVFRAGVAGNVLSYTGAVNDALDTYRANPTEDAKEEFRQTIIELKTISLEESQLNFPNITDEVAPFLTMANTIFDLALESVDNDAAMKSVVNANKVITEVALNDIFKEAGILSKLWYPLIIESEHFAIITKSMIFQLLIQ